MAEETVGCQPCENCGIYAFWNPDSLGAGGERYDFTQWVGGRDGRNDPAFGTPARMVTRSETFLADGAYMGSWHNSTRIIRIPVNIQACNISATAVWADTVDVWDEIVEQLDVFPQALKVQIATGTDILFFEVLPSSTYEAFYSSFDRLHGFFQGELELECQPYALGPLEQVTVSLP